MAKRSDQSTYLFGLRLTRKSRARVLKEITSKLDSQDDQWPLHVYTLNPEQAVIAQENDDFRRILTHSSLNLVDGAGLAWAVKRIHNQEIEVIPGIDLAREMIDFCVERDYQIMFIGGHPGVAKEAATKIKAETGGKAKIVATHGFKDIMRRQSEEDLKIVDLLRRHRPKLVLVGFGAPYQEIWNFALTEHYHEFGVKVAMVVGGSFDVWAGRVPRAPQFMRARGLEWLWRLLVQPWRAKRQLRLIKFVQMVLNHKP